MVGYESVPLGLAVLAGIVWAIRLESRVDKNQTASELAHGSLKDDLKDIREDVVYIRQRVDSALNGRGYRG